MSDVILFPTSNSKELISIKSELMSDLNPKQQDEILKLVSDKIHKQVERTRTEESSPKNTTLYFSILLETKDLLKAIMNLLEEYHNAHDSSVKPATLQTPEEE